MRVIASRPAILLPLVTAAVLALPKPTPAAEPGWRTDYNAARKEAADKGMALFVVVGTDNCFYCKKLEAGPCRDAAVTALIAANFIPLKLDAGRDPSLVKALKVQLYPTIVLAGPDGKIHAFLEGYVEAERLADQLRRTAALLTTNLDWASKDLELATRALTVGDYGRAVGLLKTISRDGVDRPAGAKAQQMLDELERLVAGKVSKARELEQRGYTQDAMDLLAEAVRVYAGTQGATDAAILLTSLSAKPENMDRLRSRTARDLLALAREDFRTGRYYDCLQRCEQLTQYADLAEGKDAASLAADVRADPDRLAKVCEQMTQRTATMYLTLAESWSAKGQTAEAINCYEKVMKLYPNSRTSDIALARMTKLKADLGLPVRSGP